MGSKGGKRKGGKLGKCVVIAYSNSSHDNKLGEIKEIPYYYFKITHETRVIINSTYQSQKSVRREKGGGKKGKSRLLQ